MSGVLRVGAVGLVCHRTAPALVVLVREVVVEAATPLAPATVVVTAQVVVVPPHVVVGASRWW